jgi:hypothetical protein
MISECIKKYEVRGKKFTAEGSDDEDTDRYIEKHLDLNKNNHYWTLYSGVGEFYGRFGFKSIREMDWLIYEEEIQNSVPELEEYADGQVTILEVKDIPEINKYFTDPKYIPYVNDEVDALIRSTSPEGVSIQNFYLADGVVSSHYGKNYKYVGVRIAHPSIDKETFAIIATSIDTSGIAIHKLFTNLNASSDEQLLAKDLDYVIKFLRIAYYDYFVSRLPDELVKSVKFVVTNHDICTKDKETYDYIFKTLNKTWKLDTGNKDFLPMMKDWAKTGITDGVKWINNGFWCFG